MIRFEKVTAGYGHKLPLKNFSAELPEQGVVVLFGPSGCGKTTLLRLLLHGDNKRPPADAPRLYGGRIEGVEALRISCVFQEDRLLPWRTSEENVALVNPPGNACALLCSLGLTAEDCRAYPAALSGGMQRRVAIARALNFPGNFLLLDEPFKGLDEGTRDLVAARLQGAFPLTLLVTHDPKDAVRMGASWEIRLSPDGAVSCGPTGLHPGESTNPAL
ncbi:MAG: ATP-binding cassette domain-containing protein [Candidatus Pelethousia sp.]|nr:ATP-binding cassette domain-containing protein [Candidatus Pelethousia sp.]